MSEEFEWEIPASVQPHQRDCAFDLEVALSSVVALRSTIPDDAFTAGILGTERAGNGVVISDDGLVLTIGYLITEAETIWLLSNDGKAIPGHALAYDQETGFGLVQALGRLSVPAIEIGSSADINVDEPVVVAGQGGIRHSVAARVTGKREFAGYWEYVLDEAIFTAPPHPNWGGTALFDPAGRLCGIGSLLVQEAMNNEKPVDGNMIVPIDLLKPVLSDLRAYGKIAKPARPWLGVFVTEMEQQLIVAGLAPNGPAEKAKAHVGDVVLSVGGRDPASLAGFFRAIWALGEAGTPIPLTIMRDGNDLDLVIQSADRADFLKSPQLH